MTDASNDNDNVYAAQLYATATPADEIAKQHEEAKQLLKSMEYVAAVNHGAIPLSQKQQPIAALPLSFQIDYDKPVVSSRGTVDVSPLVDLIRCGYDYQNRCFGASNSNVSTHAEEKKSDATKCDYKCNLNLFDEEVAKKLNVGITRPSHDKWGIEKIVLMFCDDFLQKVYELPWWHATNSPSKNIAKIAESFQSCINPILETLEVKPTQVVRLLLASMPPGVTIPVHHDTGEWVRHTHRVHVPIITNPDEVLFRVGPTVDRMDRIDVFPGHVFEMNNQAKHAVSNHWEKYRVHLILDYVDEEFVSKNIKERIKLYPGETLLQTRRAIDRKRDKGKRKTPSFIILGAQKAGTTSMYDYINQHPLVVKARRRETHCLDWRWNASLTTSKGRQNYCLKFFHTEELQFYPSLMTGDSTPSYLVSPDLVIPRVKEVCPWVKFIVMLRDPVKRARSHYAMVTSEDGNEEQKKNRGVEWLGKSFDEVIAQEFDLMNSCGLIPYWKDGEVDNTQFQSFCGSSEEEAAWSKYQKHIPMNTGSYGLITRGMYELQLRRWMKEFPPTEKDGDRFLVLKLEDVSLDGGVEAAASRAFQHLDLPPYEVADPSAKNVRIYPKLGNDHDPIMSKNTKVMLSKFYEPHNRRLEFMLGKEWTDPW